MVSLPRVVCECGSRLDLAPPSHNPMSADTRLASLSARALEQGLPLWDRRHVLAYFKSLLAVEGRSDRGGYQTILSKEFLYSIGERSFVRLARSVTSSDMDIYLKGHLTQGSAPEFCALLVALNMDLDKAITGFKINAAQGIVFSSAQRPVNAPMSIEKSQLYLLEIKKKGAKASFSNRHFWYMQLNDPQWLRQQFPSIRDNPIPSIEDDRKELKEILLRPHIKPSRLRLIVRVSAAGVRAQFRDSTWIEEQLSLSQQATKTNVGMLRDEIIGARVTALENALKIILENEGRPKRISAPALGELAGLSHSQALGAIRSHRPLQDAIEMANKDKIRRQIFWAAAQLHNVGGRLTKEQIGKLARLRPAEISNAVISEIRSLYFPVSTE